MNNQNSKIVGLALIILVLFVAINYNTPNKTSTLSSRDSDMTLHLNTYEAVDTVECTVEKAIGEYLKNEGVELDIGDTITLTILYYRRE